MSMRHKAVPLHQNIMRHLWLFVLALRWRVAGIVENRMNNCICIGKNQNLFPMFFSPLFKA